MATEFTHIEKFDAFKTGQQVSYAAGISVTKSNPADRGVANLYHLSKSQSQSVGNNSPKDPALYIGDLGQPVYSDLYITEGSYIDSQGNVITYPSIRIPQVLFTITQTKNIIETSVQGLNDTIKEYISEGSWMISVKGVLVGKNGIYPSTSVQNLKRILSASCAIPVTSEWLNQFDIHNIVITDKDIPQVMGGQSQQEFNFNAKSDTPIELF